MRFFLNNQIVDAGKNEGEDYATGRVHRPVLVGKNAADRNDGDKNKHNNVKKNAQGFAFDVFWQGEHSAEENRGGNHGVSRRERRLAGAVGASIKNPDFVKNEIDNRHKSKWDWEGQKFAVDFFNGFAVDKLGEAENGKNCQYCD